MSVYTFSNKEILETELLQGNLSDASINNSNLDTLQSNNAVWQKTDMTDSNCNDAAFYNTKFSDCSFFRSSMINSQFTKCTFNNTKHSGISFIKVHINNSRIENHLFDSCTMQRAVLNKVIIQNSSLKDFEAVYADIKDTVFIHCLFELNYGSGSNGFSGAALQNCIFINCSFSGYPMRGSKLTNCTFINCSGETTDDFEADNTFGLPYCESAKEIPITNREQAMELLNKLEEVKNV